MLSLSLSHLSLLVCTCVSTARAGEEPAAAFKSEPPGHQTLGQISLPETLGLRTSPHAVLCAPPPPVSTTREFAREECRAQGTPHPPTLLLACLRTERSLVSGAGFTRFSIFSCPPPALVFGPPLPSTTPFPRLVAKPNLARVVMGCLISFVSRLLRALLAL